MGRGRYREPSPLKSGVVHAGLSFAVFGGIAAVIGTGIHFTGDADAAGPRQVIALFEVAPTEAPSLSGRLPDDLDIVQPEAPMEDMVLEAAVYDEPSLGVPAPGETAQYVSIPSPVEAKVEGIRINGKFVPNGQSLSQVAAQKPEAETTEAAAPKAAPKTISADGLYERTALGKLPIKAKDGRSVMQAHARPFSNPDGKPAVSLIIGGLGTARNGKYTSAAIDELPPEITLSFVANAANLKSLVRRARAAGHEVIIEAPMEAYETGRRRAHPKQLSTALSPVDNLAHLAWAMSQTDGYVAIMNYEGGKFATDASVVAPVMKELSRRGVGFVESGELPGSVIAVEAARAAGHYAHAPEIIDAQADGVAIEERLKELERLAMEHGKALGTGFPYPVTIDTVKAWAERLESKGILLAPASSTLTVPKAQPAVAATANSRAAISDGAR